MAYALALFFSKLVAYTFLYWLPNFLANVSIEGVSAEKAAWLSTIFDIGGICGGIIAGLLSDTALVGSFADVFRVPCHSFMFFHSFLCSLTLR